MYDNLKICRQMLPISEDVRKRIKSDYQWQTKDFECILSMAEIKDDGTLRFRYARNVWNENVKTGIYYITIKSQRKPTCFNRGMNLVNNFI